MQGFVLAAIGILITLAVYGFVALIVKADDVGISIINTSSSVAQAAGRALVYGLPIFLKLLAAVGTAAMLGSEEASSSMVWHNLATVLLNMLFMMLRLMS